MILVIAVNHRVGQSLIYGNFNPLFGLFRRAIFSIRNLMNRMS